MFGKVLFNVCLQVFKSIKLAHVLCKLIVESRHFFNFDFVNFYSKHSVFAFQIFRVVFFREFNVDVLFFPYIHTDELFFKTGDKHSAADCKRLLFGCASVEFYAVYAAGIVKYNFVAVLYRSAADFYHSCVLFSHFVDFIINVFRRNCFYFLFDFKVFIFAQSNFRLYGNERGKFYAVVVYCRYVNVGSIHRENFAFFVKHFVIVFRKCLVESVFIEKAFAVCIFQNLTRNVPFAKTDKIIFAFRLLINAFYSAFPLFCVYRKTD